MIKPIGGSATALEGPGLRAFSLIAELWNLTDQEQSAILGRPINLAGAQLEATAADEISPETLERISYALGIYRALHILFPDQQQADSWIRRPNEATPFKGGTALALMCTGRLSDLASVREYLDAQGIEDP
ncbi:MbcA/ParS/Xre antitoxin family protein [Stenotrophomonas maltophilia]|uniref:MbcA/ParS/Xre antitoxin family protein n=1 Tax=Stenotrophomonas maltophilia TaxID=40324 RepID=UPI001070320F|nr:MbcA/ParS/Xre antitoxin family protein [Stenotrophomonas maltophilia]UKJ25881.1 MbcA/ParS/Xre antitoxin family protein [Stenotrophomonas maltophilia]